MSNVPRLRLFAGPNGSGKSTLKQRLPAQWLGHYLNPDDLERELRQVPLLNVARFNLPVPDAEAVTAFCRAHPLAAAANLTAPTARISAEADGVRFAGIGINSYVASVLSDWLRQQLIATGQSFTFESVMSAPAKLDTLRQARAAGFRVYLYYVSTVSAQLNVARVRQRVAEGGHNVAEDKIRERYERSLDLLLPAVRLTDRAFIFDNSGTGADFKLLAEVTDGRELTIKETLLPDWFARAVLSKLSGAA